jgi:signal transduction histidine kinase
MSDTNGGPREIIIHSASAHGSAEASISDTGPGISADKIRNVFDPFSTTKQNGIGIGIGPSIVRTIVEAHSGNLSAENGTDGDAIFRIRLSQSGSQGRFASRREAL